MNLKSDEKPVKLSEEELTTAVIDLANRRLRGEITAEEWIAGLKRIGIE